MSKAREGNKVRPVITQWIFSYELKERGIGYPMHATRLSSVPQVETEANRRARKTAKIRVRCGLQPKSVRMNGWERLQEKGRLKGAMNHRRRVTGIRRGINICPAEQSRIWVRQIRT